MLDEEISQGGCCCLCHLEFRDTENARISHGWMVVCHDCWDSLSPEKKKQTTKAFFYKAGYEFGINVLHIGLRYEFTVKPLHQIDQVVYEIYDDGLLCVVGLNEKANWDVDRPIDKYLVYEIGKAIEQKEAN